MKPKVTNKKVSSFSPILTQTIRKSLLLYLLSAVTVPLICFVFGWRSSDNVGTGFIYGSLGLTLFGVLTFAGNTVPAQLSQLSLPKYTPLFFRRHQEAESDDASTTDEGTKFFFSTLLCGVCLLVTGLFFKLF